LGLSSGPAALRAIAEATGADASSPPDATTRSAWASKLAMGSIGAYGDLLATVWSQYSGKTFRDTTAILEAYDRGAGQDLPNQEGFGGKTIGSLDTWGVKLKRIRGDAKLSGGLDAQLDSFDMFCEVEVRP